MQPNRKEPGPGSRLYFNKNIYDRRELLIWPAYTPVTPELLRLAERRGIPIGADDLETANEALLRAADAAFDELGDMFRDAEASRRIDIGKLRRTTVPQLIESLTSASLAHLLVHLMKKDDQTLRHSIGVTALSVMLGKWLGVSAAELENLALAALLHDIGKLKVDRTLLNKPFKLSQAEFEEIKRHTVYGYDMLRQDDGSIPEVCALAALNHHERFDGSGYPHGLGGSQVDPLCRIIAIADVFHAMSSKRPYKDKLPFYEVVREMHASAFGQFDPEFIFTFLRHIMESLIGAEVTLSTGARARIVALSSPDPLRPLVQANGRFLDLSKSRHIHILGYE